MRYNSRSEQSKENQHQRQRNLYGNQNFHIPSRRPSGDIFIPLHEYHLLDSSIRSFEPELCNCM